MFSEKKQFNHLKQKWMLREDPTSSRVFVINSIRSRPHLFREMVEKIENYGPLASNDKIVLLSHHANDDLTNLRATYETIYQYYDKRDAQVLLVKTKIEDQLSLMRFRPFKAMEGHQNWVNEYRSEVYDEANNIVKSDVDAAQLVADRQWLDSWPFYREVGNLFFTPQGVSTAQELSKQVLKAFAYVMVDMDLNDVVYDKIVVYPTNKEKVFVGIKNEKIYKIGIPTPKDAVFCAVLNKDTGELIETMVVKEKVKEPTAEQPALTVDV